MKSLAALLTLLGAACVVTYVYKRSHAEPASPALVPTSEMPVVPPEPIDERPVGAILRERVQWPIQISLTKEHPVKIDQDSMITLPVGRKLRATMLTDDGLLLTHISDVAVQIPFENTDFLAVIESANALRQPVSTFEAPTQSRSSLPIIHRVDPAKRLAELKAQFPVAEKRKTQVLIRNAAVNQRSHAVPNHASRRFDTIEVDVPHPDMFSKYRGWVMAASPSSLPEILSKLETQVSRDMTDLRNQYGSHENQFGNTQAQYSYEWLNSKMRPYLAQLKAVAVAR